MRTTSFGTACGQRHRRVSWPRFALLTLLGVALTVAGVLSLSRLSWNEARTHLVAGAWPTAEATISSVTLVEESRVRPDRRVETELVLSVVYAYEVDGQLYEGYRGALSDRAALHDRDLRTLYRKLNFARITGRIVPASYDPHEPALAYLDTGFDWKAAAAPFGLGLAAIGWGLSLIGAAARRKGAASLL